ncbi:MAG TPA: alpha-L-arabinofuranosidase C-terminal domain-containing protein [Verrucomicrobiae bacterium]|nr:alpha-L-arabinofuranosidase C-terminal domain-containing protein [Verrucomicrobiae bacterium]
MTPGNRFVGGRHRAVSPFSQSLAIVELLVVWLCCWAGGLSQAAAGEAPPIQRLQPAERDFFSKQIVCRGIPIKAHEVVADEALREAFRRLDKMLSHQPNLVANLITNRVALHIIGRGQVTTDLPEWRHDKGKPLPEYGGLTRDERTRGMGGRLASCGEENLLRLPNDKYHGRDICVHEFAHAVRNLGMSRDVRERFDEQYQQSIGKGLWTKGYAAVNADEFFSELSMWYFGTHGDMNMTEPKPESGPEGLRKYDPAAYALLDDFYSGRLQVSLVEPRPVRRRAIIDVDVRGAGPAVNPRMYGIFLEEINHGVDGGLYAEMIRNRGFEDSRPPEGYAFRNGRWRDEHGFDSGFSRYGYTTNGVPFWTLLQRGDAAASMHLQTAGGVTEASGYCVRLDVERVDGGHVGLVNEGFFGIGIREGQNYQVSLYARAGTNFSGALWVRFEDAEGNACSDAVQFDVTTRDWKRYSGRITARTNSAEARFVVGAAFKGSVWLDFVSVFPEQTWRSRSNGLRPDLAQLIADLKPGFVRFPGGCVVDAGTVETAYDWKLTVGPLEQRQERWGPWNYRRTQGMGLFEYFQFCEDLGAEPLWVGFAGQTCIHREREHVPMSEMGRIRDNFLDVMEYANGAADSQWGRLRADAGHSGPFNLRMVEIGNENQGREYGERYRFIHDAMKARHPDIQYLADLSWTSRESMGGARFEIEDRHYYSSTAWFAGRFKEYDGRDRALPPLYLGEVAVTSGDAGNTRGNLRAALAEGIFLLGCERNADTVQMVSYAPLLGHVEGRTELTGAPPPWHAMIYFDGTRSFGTASYYLWKMFGKNVPARTVPTEVNVPSLADFRIAGQIGVGTWNTSAEFKDVRVEKNGETLYSSDFSEGSEGWIDEQRRGGQWTIHEGAFRQGQPGRSSRFYGDPEWSDYTLSLKARKLAGGEGFLVQFGRKGGETYWWNLGGWGNTQHAVEFSSQGNQNVIGIPARGRIETNRWYDIRIQLAGKNIRCYLDGERVHDVTAEPTPPVYAVAGRDEKAGELVLKVINSSSEAYPAHFRFGSARFESEVWTSTLTSADPADNNSLETAEKVTPRNGTTQMAGGALRHELPPHSFTIFRLKEHAE